MEGDVHVHIVGLGLIGGSIAHGLRDNASYRVTGWDLDRSRARSARERGYIEGIAAPSELPPGVDGVMLAVPVPSMVGVVEQLLEATHPPAFLTDVGSTKQWIHTRLGSLLPEELEFIGAHPMAGSEESGLEAADPYLFENAICVVTVPSTQASRHLSTVTGLWGALGAHVTRMTPEAHDRAVAHVSHLPHLLAAAMVHGVRYVPDHEETALPLAAGGFRDTTRIAAGDPQLWRDIFQTNQDAVLEALDHLREVLEEIGSALEEGRWNRVTTWLQRARELRDQIPEKSKGLMGTLHELRVQAPDEPGILAQITAVLGDESINIADIEVLRVREGERGTIRLRFRELEECDRARRILDRRAERVEVL